MADLARRMAELMARRDAAMAAVEQARRELQEKEQETKARRRELEEAEEKKKNASDAADLALRLACGEREAGLLADCLKKQGFGIVDGFMGADVAERIRQELLHMHNEGHMALSELAGGRTGDNLRYTMAEVRGDVVRFVNGTEQDCQGIGILRDLSDQVIIRVQERIPELAGEVIQRGNLMCTCYPGGASRTAPCGRGGPCRYVLHCDNPDRNGRRLTALYYVNKGWEPEHGGQLRIYPSDETGKSIGDAVDVDPVFDRFLLFFSDKRCPHEVLDARAPRYAITTWYYSAEERKAAYEIAGHEQEIERDRIRKEIEKFEAKSRAGENSAKASPIEMVRDTCIPGVLSQEIIATGGSIARLDDLEVLD